jgi:D-sedoheptulose 7-phosphate isomerase
VNAHGCADDAACLTCGDVAVQARVTALLPDGLARVDAGAGEEEVSVALVEAGVGDVVLVHAKEAIALVPGLNSLYPFLGAAPADRAPVRAQAAGSTADKAAEIVALRARVESELGPGMIACAVAMAERFTAGGRLFAFGNGGSSSDAQAVAQLFCAPARGRPLPALGLTNDIAAVTALANDVGFDVVFARQIAAFGRPGDIAVALSTSGGSQNVLRGLEEAHRRGLLTVGLAGYAGGPMAAGGMVDHLFVVPSSSVHRIQEAQTTVYDVLWELTQRALA